MGRGDEMKIYVAGHRGLVGSALVRAIEKSGEHTWVGKTRHELNLLDRSAVFEFVKNEQPDWVIVAAAKVGGIHANATYPVEFLSENLQIETNLIDACHEANIDRVLFLGSSCIYPKECPQPISEDYLLTGPLEPTNEAYALAKISGLKLVQAYRKQYGHKWISAMPTNLYGPGDNFDLQNSHVLPALIRRFHEAKVSGTDHVTLWGSGTPMREFLHSDDLAAACLHLLASYDEDVAINVGTGIDIPISELANQIKAVTGYQGSINWDTSKPDGTMRKVLDVSKLKQSGWVAQISLVEGLQRTYEDYKSSLT
jgi:GDP-L-fucose synthase